MAAYDYTANSANLFPKRTGRAAAFRRPGSWLAAAIFVFFAPVTLWAEASFSLPADGEVLRYQRQLGEIDHVDKGPEVVVYADGRLVVRRPAYQSRPGLWQMAMPADELQTLIGDVVEAGLLDTDTDQLLERRRRSQQRRVEEAQRSNQPLTVYAAGGPDRSVLTISVERYRPAGELGDAAAPLSRTWTWSDLHGDADRFQEIRELVAFDHLEHRLIEYIDHPNLEEVSP